MYARVLLLCLHSALSVIAAFFSTVRPFVIVQSSSFFPSFLSVTGEDLMSESDIQLLSPSLCASTSPRFRALSIDRKTNLSQSVSIVIECGGILNLTQPHTKP